MENPEEILHSLEEFSKMKPKDIPRELEEYLCYVAKTGNPVYQWQTIKSLFREKLLSVITEFYESCPAVEIPPCPNVEIFNYDLMKNFILEKLDTFSAAPFTVQRICELLTTPRKEYNRIDKYMRALEKNILVVSTTEPNLGRRSTENGEGIMNGLESDHLLEGTDSNHDINVEEMDESPSRLRATKVIEEIQESGVTDNQVKSEEHISHIPESDSNIDNQLKSEEVQICLIQENFESESEDKTDITSTTIPSESVKPDEQVQQDSAVTCATDNNEVNYVSIEAVSESCASHQDNDQNVQSDVSVTITPIPSDVQDRPDVEISKEADGTPEPEEGVAKCEEEKTEKNVQSDEGDQQNEQISTSVTSPNESPCENLVESNSVASDLQEMSAEIPDVTVTATSSFSDSETFSKAVQIEVCSESEKSEPQTSQNVVQLTEESGTCNEIVSSAEETPVETMDQPFAVITANSNSGNLADSSTSQDEVSESQVKPSDVENVENMEKILQPEDTKLTDEAETDSKQVSEDVPMEVDIVSESECKEKVVADEPSSTSNDNNL